MAMNVSVQYNGGFLPDDTLDPMLLPSSGNPIKYYEEVWLFAAYGPTQTF